MRSSEAKCSLRLVMMRPPIRSSDGLAIDDRAPEIERGHVAHEDQELLDIAAIGADPLTRHLDLFRRGVGRQDQQGRIARCARRNEQNDHEEDERDERLQHTTARCT